MRLIILSLIFLFTPIVIAEQVIEQHTTYYKVKVSSKEKLLESVNHASPIRENGKVFHGYTRFDIRWRFNWEKTAKRCRLVRVKTILQLKYTMPELDSDSQQVNTVWAPWYSKLLLHEQGHGELAITFASKIEDALKSMRPQRDCKTLSDDANTVAYKIVEQLNKASAAYDVKTNHGETQGAWLHSHL
ncbi:DUF922 domain-containing Zn-dependent protease [Pseudoalteromonas sp. NEC-BIFX-2020_015]|uniref:DUF922 domain-containing Zn-dependent protease n=1 Tax=Pseudoalteromonas sp. NEC-BIFX-2020_015 TaxID=2729544 RepID=UPI0014616BD6|nr:DUF922 domain-containing protein [Pseudoalteromonas sp. NEC-BIFX-2020_015]NMR25889.1 DUF922 domain-containing Zn-dependent protease [Pseudoalteromonas sp. NEC-BIFX-2020_015]